MSLGFIVHKVVASLLLPPLNFLILIGVGLFLLSRRRQLGKALIAFSLAGLAVLAMPVVSNAYLGTLMPPYREFDGREADAIVVLGAGRYKNALEYGGDTVNSLSLERVRQGARLSRHLHKPVLLTGGSPLTRQGALSEAELMAEALEIDFGVKPRWLEKRSLTTLENATYSAEMLRKDGIQRIYLVSHAWHLARAIPEFERLGLTVVPAGTGYQSDEDLDVFSFLPSASALLKSFYASHEWLGRLWYRLLNGTA